MKHRRKENVRQGSLIEQALSEMLDQRHRLYKLAHGLPWGEFERAFGSHYSENGRPALPIRRMVGLLLLKQLENLSDERVCEAWSENPYMQYFTGEQFFQWGLPCDPTELVKFRHRIGEAGTELVLKISIQMHAPKLQKETELVADTTVQEANITYPTDTKLRVKVIERLWRMGEEAGINWSHSYKRTVPTLLARLRTRSNRLSVQRRKAERKLKTLAGRLLREFKRGCSAVDRICYREELELLERVLHQKRSDKNKVYSLHDPEALCIAKGKAHKPYEFGRKASVAMLRDSGLIVSAVSFKENLYDGDTLPLALATAHDLCGKTFESVLVDRGYRGRTQVGSIDVVLPDRKLKGGSYYLKRKERKRRARRSAIEPVIGHLKHDYRMARCFLKGALGASQNLHLAAAAWNLKMWMRDILLRLFAYLQITLLLPYPKLSKQNLNHACA